MTYNWRWDTFATYCKMILIVSIVNIEVVIRFNKRAEKADAFGAVNE